jgi:hypothetical protein
MASISHEQWGQLSECELLSVCSDSDNDADEGANSASCFTWTQEQQDYYNNSPDWITAPASPEPPQPKFPISCFPPHKVLAVLNAQDPKQATTLYLQLSPGMSKRSAPVSHYVPGSFGISRPPSPVPRTNITAPRAASHFPWTPLHPMPSLFPPL